MRSVMGTRHLHVQETPGITKWHIASEVETKRKLSFEGLFQRKILSDVKHIRFEETRLLALRKCLRLDALASRCGVIRKIL